MNNVEITEEKVRKLIPIAESIWSRRYGKKITLKSLTLGNVTAYKSDCEK